MKRIDRLSSNEGKDNINFTDSEAALMITSADTDSTSESDSDLYVLWCMHLFCFKIYVFGSL